MSIHETLQEYIDQKRKVSGVSENYVPKLNLLEDFSDETQIWDARDTEFADLYTSWGLTSSQRAGVSNIIGSAGHVVLFDENDRFVKDYQVTAGDIRLLNDDDLERLTGSTRGARVLRALFGTKQN